MQKLKFQSRFQSSVPLTMVVVQLPQPTPRSEGRFLLRREDAEQEEESLPVEYIEHAKRLREKAAAAESVEEARRQRASFVTSKAGSIGNLSARSRPAPPPRSRDQMVHSAALLASAAGCEALLQGSIAPTSFAHTVSNMPPEMLEKWMFSFGTCIARLSGTLSDLHAQLNRQLRSTTRSNLKDSTQTVLQRVECVEDALQAIDERARAEVVTAAADADRMLRVAADRLCAVPLRCTRRWTKFLVAATLATRRERRKVEEALIRVNLSSGDVGELADSICEHAKALVGCDEACLYVGVRAKGSEAFYRLCPTRSSDEEAAASTSRVLGTAAAAPIPARSIAGSTFGTSLSMRLVRSRGESDDLYVEQADRIPGYPPPTDLLYYNLSDATGGLRAVLRLGQARVTNRPPGGGGSGGSSVGKFGAFEVEALRQVAPVFSLALRRPMHAAAASSEESALAASMSSISACLADALGADLPTLVDLFGAQARKLLDADRCSLFLFDEPNNQLQNYGGGQAAPVTLSLDVPAGQTDEEKAGRVGIAGLSVLTNTTFSIKDAQVDPRFNAAVDGKRGSTTRSILAMPFESISTGGIMGVCEVFNKKGAAQGYGTFTDADETMLDSLLKLAALAIENCQLAKDYAVLREQVGPRVVAPAVEAEAEPELEGEDADGE